MKKVIKINGKEMGIVNTRNNMHFEIQKNNRAKIQENKKAYKRCRDKKVVFE